MNDTEIKLLTLMNSFGDIIELDWEFDSDTIIEELKQGEWEEGTNGKRGMNLTGPVNGIGLTDKNRHAAGQEFNDNLNKSPSLLEFFKKWDNVSRCRAAHMEAGSFFKMHRDAHKMNPQMRIFIPLNKTDVSDWNFIYDTRRETFKPGVPYILNTRKQHGSFAFTGGIYHVLMSLHISEHNVKTVMNMLPNCREF